MVFHILQLKADKHIDKRCHFIFVLTEFENDINLQTYNHNSFYNTNQ